MVAGMALLVLCTLWVLRTLWVLWALWALCSWGSRGSARSASGRGCPRAPAEAPLRCRCAAPAQTAAPTTLGALLSGSTPGACALLSSLVLGV